MGDSERPTVNWHAMMHALRDDARSLRNLEDLARRSLTLHPSRRPDLNPRGYASSKYYWWEDLFKNLKACRDAGYIAAEDLGAMQKHVPTLYHWDRLEDGNATDEEVEALRVMKTVLRSIADRIEADTA